MRHLPVEPPAFFHRGPSPLARLAFFGLVSLALLFLDTRGSQRSRRGSSWLLGRQRGHAAQGGVVVAARPGWHAATVPGGVSPVTREITNW